MSLARVSAGVGSARPFVGAHPSIAMKEDLEVDEREPEVDDEPDVPASPPHRL
jgi:hypothetical protein